MTATRQRWTTFAIVSLALFMGMLDNLVVTTALPAIQKALHATTGDLEWTVNAYTLAFTIFIIPAATIGDRFGRRRFLLLGVALFTLGSAASALSTTMTGLVLGRALQGIGGAFITPLTLTILTRAFPTHLRAAAIGLWSGVSGLGLAAGPLVGGAIVNGLTWNAVFWVNVPIGLFLLVVGRLGLQESRVSDDTQADAALSEAAPLDIPGLVLIGLGLFGVVYGLIRGNALGWTSIGILGPIGLGVALLIIFIRRQGASATPMVDLTLFKARGFTIANLVGFLMSFGMFGSIWLLTLFMQSVQGASPLRAGLETMPWTGTIMLVAPLAGILAGRIGPRYLVTIGMAAQAIALYRLASLASVTVPYTTLLPAFLLGGLGMGLAFAPLSDAVMGATAAHRQGQASGVYNTLRELGGVFGVAILGAVFQHIVVHPNQFLDGFRAALYSGAGVLGVAVLIALFLPQPRLRRAEQTALTPALAETVAA